MNAAPIGGSSSQRHEMATLLVVEDDVLIRHSVCEALRHATYKVLEASSAREALTILDTLPVDLLFVDLHMPGESDGVSVARYARRHFPEIPVLLTSGKLRASAVPDLDDLGPFIPKPYLISRLLDRIRDTLENSDPG